MKLNLITTPTTYSGVIFTPNDDGTITLNGTATSTRWVDISNIDYGSIAFNLGVVTNTIKSLTSNNYTMSAKITNEKVNVNYNANNKFTSCYIYKDTNYNNAILQIQLEKSTSATSYEPYQGKDYEINLGKNLVNPSNFKFYTQANASCSYDYDTNILTMTTLREVTSSELFLCTKIEDSLLKNGKSYTISSTNVSGVVYSLKLQLRNKDGTNASKPQGTTITYDDNYSLFIVDNPFASSGSTVVPQGTIAVIKDIQVEERKCSN